jgi:hypothetical protein
MRVELRVGREAKRGVRQKIISHALQRGQEKTPEKKNASGNRICKIPRSFSIGFVMP